MSSQRPLIGVTGPDEGGQGAWLFTALSIWLAGGKALRITPSSQQKAHRIDGLILGGGADVEPVKYGEIPIEKKKRKQTPRKIGEWILTILFFPLYWLARYFQRTKRSPIDKRRDELEFRLLNEALKQEKPVLGICRGMQLINVHFKGSLYQDISGFYKETAQISSILPRKNVLIKEETLLREILQTDQCLVNALHNQAIKNVGEGIRVVAKEEKTTIFQALEHPEFPFVLGVQWHPEYLIQHRRQRRIFKQLVHCAAQK